MKLIYIIDFSTNSNSGKSKATLEKAKELEKQVGKDNFIFIYPKFNKSKIKNYYNRLCIDFKAFKKVLFIKEDIIIIQRVIILPLSRILFWFKGYRVVSEYHADLREEIKHLGKSKIENFTLYITSYLFNFNYHISNGIIYNHPILKEKFDRIFKKPSIYSYNGSNTREYYPLEMKICRDQLKIDNDKVVFLFLGSVTKWHGVDLLINIFNDPKFLNNPNIFLYIVGAKDNKYVDSLKKSNKSQSTIFVPPVDLNLALKYINASNFCLLPVKQIRTSPGSPLKLYDYIACGKTVIAQKDLKGYSDEVEKYNLGYTIDFAETKLAAKKLLKYSAVNKNKYFAKNNRNIAEFEVSWNKRIDKWIKFINTI